MSSGVGSFPAVAPIVCWVLQAMNSTRLILLSPLMDRPTVWLWTQALRRVNSGATLAYLKGGILTRYRKRFQGLNLHPPDQRSAPERPLLLPQMDGRNPSRLKPPLPFLQPWEDPLI